MVKICEYCGFVNKRQLVPNPIKCPHCGNPFGKKPSRKLHGWWTK